MPRHVACWGTLFGALLLTGCSKQSSPPANIDAGPQADSLRPGETFLYVIAREVEYYNSGPQQGRPPDGKFPAGTKVNVLRRTGGISLVRSPDGIEAYVMSEAILEPGAESLP